MANSPKSSSNEIVAAIVPELFATALQSWSQYQQVREQRFALEAQLEAEIRKSEIQLEALQARLKAATEFMIQNQKENSEKRAALSRLFDAAHSTAAIYIEIHTKLILCAKSESDKAYVQQVWGYVEPFIAQMNDATTQISRQTLGWLEV